MARCCIPVSEYFPMQIVMSGKLRLLERVGYEPCIIKYTLDINLLWWGTEPYLFRMEGKMHFHLNGQRTSRSTRASRIFVRNHWLVPIISEMIC